MMRGAARSEGWLPAEEGLRLHYQLCGSGSQAVVVPLAVYLAGPLGPLADGQRLIFYDLRGRGRSDAVRDPARIGITHDLTDVEAVRRHFGLERMALVGFSYVGAIAAVYAAEHPDRVSRLVALGAMAPSAALGRSYNPPEKALRVQDRHAPRGSGGVHAQGDHLPSPNPFPLQEASNLRLLALPFEKEGDSHIEASRLGQVF